jgi:hypothetical protein
MNGATIPRRDGRKLMAIPAKLGGGILRETVAIGERLSLLTIRPMRR